MFIQVNVAGGESPSAEDIYKLAVSEIMVWLTSWAGRPALARGLLLNGVPCSAAACRPAQLQPPPNWSGRRHLLY